MVELPLHSGSLGDIFRALSASRPYAGLIRLFFYGLTFWKQAFQNYGYSTLEYTKEALDSSILWMPTGCQGNTPHPVASGKMAPYFSTTNHRHRTLRPSQSRCGVGKRDAWFRWNRAKSAARSTVLATRWSSSRPRSNSDSKKSNLRAVRVDFTSLPFY